MNAVHSASQLAMVPYSVTSHRVPLTGTTCEMWFSNSSEMIMRLVQDLPPSSESKYWPKAP